MAMEMSDVELDLPPEYCHYRDEGCELHPSCLRCPLPRCVYDEPGGKGQWHRNRRDQKLLMLHREGVDVPSLVRRFGITERTVYRILRRAKHE